MARRSISILLLAGLICGFAARSAPAQPQDAARAQVAAATANAMFALKTDILSTRITPTLTVAQFLDQTDSMDALTDTIQRAEQIGGARWDDNQTTCQVKLEISGSRVAYALVSVAAVRPKLSPISAAALEQRLTDWKSRSFAATGTSISAQRAMDIRPQNVGPKWSTVSDNARSEAVAAARQDAAQNVLNNIRTIDLGSGQTVGDLTSHEQVQQAVRTWVASRPVTQLRYEDNLQVEVTVSTPPDDLFKTVFDSARTIPGTTLPTDEKTLDQLKLEFSRHANGIMGRANVSDKPQATAPVAMVELPTQPPMWTSQPIDVEATAAATNSPLRTKAAAETSATVQLRAKIGTQLIRPDLTIDQAVKQDQRLDEALTRALLRARVYKVDYRADGSVLVRMTIDSRDVWEELRHVSER